MSTVSFALLTLLCCFIISPIMAFFSVQLINDENGIIKIIDINQSEDQEDKTSKLQLFLDFTKLYMTYLLISGLIIVVGRTLAAMI